MSALVVISGGLVEAQYEFPPLSTVRDAKAQIQSDYAVPIRRQILRRRGPNNSPVGPEILVDARALESYGIGPNGWARLDLEVVMDRLVSVLVVVTSLQLPGWQEEIRCRETETVLDFKEQIAYKLGWGSPAEMVLRHRRTVMSLDNAAVIQYLVTDGSRLTVEFPKMPAPRPRL
ncbi:unnamed protein product [Linum trigynum]|uniref:Ubiquitin-like domain-containing protein n=1 Tax=Linum trigynum TaxID=586398 RepID=A0AAV2EUF1_9ROSI